jgi:AbrB family looped-hinge helix DNA binding protein
MLDTAKMARNGTPVIPAAMRRRLGLGDGELVLIEETTEGLTIRPAVAMPIEVYSPGRKAEFLLNNAMDEQDYQAARQTVQAMGLNPDEIPHDRIQP